MGQIFAFYIIKKKKRLAFLYLGSKWKKIQRPGVITSSNKKDLKYEAATITSISWVQLSASYNDTKGEVLIGYIFLKLINFYKNL